MYWLRWHLVIEVSSLNVKIQSMKCCSTNYGCEKTVEFETGVASVILLITRTHQREAHEFKIPQLPITLHNTGWMDDWKYVMDILWLFWCCTLWMLKWHTVTFHHVIATYNDMCDRIDGVMWALAKKKAQWMEDLYFAMKYAHLKLSKYHTDVTSTTGMCLISADILDSGPETAIV